MKDRKLIEGLRHKHPGYSDDEFFRDIDALGGWPLGYQYVGFEHTNSRAAGFTNSSANTGWWSIVASADDYYLWKLSPAALQRIADAVRESIRIPAVDAQKLRILNWHGYPAARTPTPEKKS